MRTLLIAAGALLLTGCTMRFDIDGQSWTRGGTALPQVTQDEMDCARTASRAAHTPETYVGGMADAVRVRLADVQMSRAFDRCMQTKGYRPIGT